MIGQAKEKKFKVKFDSEVFGCCGCLFLDKVWCILLFKVNLNRNWEKSADCGDNYKHN